MPVLIKHLHTSEGVRPGVHCKAFTKLYQSWNHPLRFRFLAHKSTMFPLLPQRCSIAMLPPRSPPLEPLTTANGDPLISESSLLCQALPIISLVVVLLCRVTWFKNRSLDL